MKACWIVSQLGPTPTFSPRVIWLPGYCWSRLEWYRLFAVAISWEWARASVESWADTGRVGAATALRAALVPCAKHASTAPGFAWTGVWNSTSIRLKSGRSSSISHQSVGLIGSVTTVSRLGVDRNDE